MLNLHHWKEILFFLKGYFHKRYPNASKALDLAMKLHNGQERKNGLPYVIHPLWVTMLLVLLDLKQDLKKMYPDKEDAYIEHMLDILYAASLLHDVQEDCVMIQEDWDGLDKEVFDLVTILTKTHKSNEEYYHKISLNFLASLIKLADRANNVLTMEAFSLKKIKEYITETHEYFVPLIKRMRTNYPKLSRTISIMETLIFSLVNTIAELLGIEKIFQKMIDVKSILDSTGKVTERAIRKLISFASNIPTKHKVHPLSVAKTLISMGITDDYIVAAAVLHELPHWSKNWELELSEFPIKVQKIIEAYQENTDMKLYYANDAYVDAILIRFANRINTVKSSVSMMPMLENEIDRYIKELNKYRVMYDYVKANHIEYEDIVDIIYWTIVSMVRTIEAIQKKLSDPKS